MVLHSSRNSSFLHKLTLLEIFRTLPKSALREFFSCVERIQMRGGEVLFEEGSPGNDLFILLAGKLQFEKQNPEGGSPILGTFRRQDLIGELSLLTGESRSATVRALRDSELIRVPANKALQILQKSPEALLEITKVIAQRLAHVNDLIGHAQPTPKSFTFLSSLPKEEIQQVLDSFGMYVLRFGSFCVIDERFYVERMSEIEHLEEIEKESAAIRLLAKIESQYDFILYLIQDQDVNSEWISRAIRQGDSFVFLKRGDSFQNFKKWDKFLKTTEKQNRPKYLAVLQTNISSICKGTIRHLQDQEYRRHFHIHLKKPDSIERLVRGLLGKSIGLALGGGGAKGFAHLGVWQALMEESIPVDMISGTSAGSIFAALIAMGKTLEEAKQDTKQIWVEKDLLNEYTLPVIALTSGKKYTETIQNFFGDIQIEDLWIPYTAISCNLTTSETVHHTRGPLWKAIRASTSIPGIIPPFLDGENILVDGGVLDNVPGIPLIKEGAGILIAVDVFGEYSSEEDKEIHDYLASPNPGILANPLSPLLSYMQKNLSLRPKFPPIGDIIIRSFLSSSRERQRETEKRSSLFLQIPTNQFGLLDWLSFSDLVELGYHSTKNRIARFAKSIPWL